jgi:hypothetical protein
VNLADELHMPKLIDLTGQCFGRLTVLHRGADAGRSVVWICQCECTPEAKIPVRGAFLKSGKCKSCGCLRAEKARSRGFDLTGQLLGCWKVLEQAPNRGMQRYWLCECICDKKTQKEVSAASLLTGRSRSCHHVRIEALPLAA